MDPKDFLRSYVSPWLKGEVVDAVLGTLAEESDRGFKLSAAVTDQLTISTASQEYLDRRLSEVSFTRPADVGISDDAFRDLGISVTATKQVSSIIQDVLEVFYGAEVVRGFTQSGKAEPYALQEGWTLELELEDGKPFTFTVVASDYASLGAATAAELADALVRQLRDGGYSQGLALPFRDQQTGQNFVRVYGAAKGPYSLVRVVGGEVQNLLEFPKMRPTDLGTNDTVWQVTRTFGPTYRFRWDGGTAPLLQNVLVGDKVAMYGPGFETVGFYGTYTVTDVRAPESSISLDSGWFEISAEDGPTMGQTLPGTSPLPNSPPLFYSFAVTLSQYSDLKFFMAQKNTAYSKQRFSVGFEPAANLLRLYLPATTQVVERSLGRGGSYLHMLLPSTDMSGSYGSPSDTSLQVQVVNDYVIRVPSEGFNNYGTGGTLTYGVNTRTIAEAWREDGFLYVRTSTAHGVPSYNAWSNTTNYGVGQQSWRNGLMYTALQSSGPGFGGGRDPLLFPTFWQVSGPGFAYSDQTIGVSGLTVSHDDPNNPYLGSYLVDLSKAFTLTNNIVTLRQEVLPGLPTPSVEVLGNLDEPQGVLLFNLGQNSEEYPVPYIAVQPLGAPTPVSISSISGNASGRVVVSTVGPHGMVPGDDVIIASTTNFNGTHTVVETPSPNVYTFNITPVVAVEAVGSSLLVNPGPRQLVTLDPGHTFLRRHAVLSDVTRLSAAQAYEPSVTGSDYPVYVTATADARTYCEAVERAIVAAGIRLEIVVIYPDDQGLGLWGTPNSERAYVWGS